MPCLFIDLSPEPTVEERKNNEEIFALVGVRIAVARRVWRAGGDANPG